ncbi:hypothetical protein CMK22_16710 [Candidatus Poribacteria bacterium]|nr:hypothetical protein [Candidatus Poribacteria bacterium]
MPEWAEVRITADFINMVTTGKLVTKIKLSPYVKLKNLAQQVFPFSISAKSRGKELGLVFQSGNWKCRYTVTLGMSGKFILVCDEDDLPKHSHARFILSDQTELVFVDVRRFGKGDCRDWAPHRGPDPYDEFEVFKNNIYTNMQKKILSKPISEILMNQNYFNGVGNYLRAEICGKFDCNPFSSAREIINDEFLSHIPKIMHQSYLCSGGSLHQWQNPFSNTEKSGKHLKETQSLQDWLEFYGKGESIVDKTGRRFWFNSKWRNFLNETLILGDPTQETGTN